MSNKQTQQIRKKESFGMPYVAGSCPMGCGNTLFLGSGGHITCSYIPCPNPGFVDEFLRSGKIDFRRQSE